MSADRRKVPEHVDSYRVEVTRKAKLIWGSCRNDDQRVASYSRYENSKMGCVRVATPCHIIGAGIGRSSEP